jgi:uncharacterized membrane protein YkvA (DUF1232 family)
MARTSKKTSRSGDRDDERRGRARRPGLRRLIALTAFLPLAGRAPLYVRLIVSLVADSRTPASHKAMLAGAVGYLALGRDLVPDSLPILGQLDDLVVVALATEYFLDGLDEALLAEKLAEAGIPRAAYEEDVARIRRLMPVSLRRLVRRVPGAIRLVSEAVSRSGLQPRVRSWVDRERASP